MKSPPPPPPTPAAFGELQRRTARPRAPPSSAPPSPPSRFSAPGLYCPLATTPPWLGFRAVLRRPVSGGPRCRWSTPWDFPIHHARCRQGQEGTLASSTSSPRMMPLLHQDRLFGSSSRLKFPTAPWLYTVDFAGNPSAHTLLSAETLSDLSYLAHLHASSFR
ncbi:uncharacterized protein [Triticum aestivum]|nr:uncharacterized protein LOC123039289 isoform X1 [Triticum aestivum]XP_044318453.1 uncharacterized protein LOC123039289 isoform X1 [Triticum aestivum]XP_044318457.1 uncharacterized protein LOC123039289 isoform X1 [Triticum aestivum]